MQSNPQPKTKFHATHLRQQEFCTVYADAVIDHDLPEDLYRAAEETALTVRQLHWRGEQMPLAEAAKLYENICVGYNEFESNMLTKLDEAFPNQGIEATPAREGSVCVYLWIPEGVAQLVEQWILINWKPNEMSFKDDGSLRIWWD